MIIITVCVLLTAVGTRQFGEMIIITLQYVKGGPVFVECGTYEQGKYLEMIYQFYTIRFQVKRKVRAMLISPI